MRKTVDSIVKQTANALGEQLEAVFLYGSLAQGFYQPDESDINLFFVISDETNWHHLRETFLPLWHEHQTVLKHAPLIATRRAFARHLQLNPLLANHMVRDGKKLLGTKPLLDKTIKATKPIESYAHLAHQALIASQALMPELLTEETAANAQRTLRGLIRRIRQSPIPAHETNAQLFARLQHYLAPLINKLPEVTAWDAQIFATEPNPPLPDLFSIYEETGKLVLAFETLSPKQILQTDWHSIATDISEDALGVGVTSAAQLFLIVAYEHPLHIHFRKYVHSWGSSFIGDIDTSQPQLLRQAARLPSEILVKTLPHHFLTQDEEAYGEIIHDFQNKLLNVQLEHELMVRFGITERFTPPEPLPDRETAPHLRINAIFQNFDWWADFYAQQLGI